METIADRLFHEKRPTQRGVHIWIGLDFGTATTECVVQIERPIPDSIAVLAFEGSSRNDAQVVFPSAMEIFDGVVLPSYKLKRKGKIIEMFKSDLVAEIRENNPAGPSLHRTDGHFCRSVRHLASVLALARRAIAGWLPSQEFDFHLNIGAPIGADRDNRDDAKIREVFHELAYRALELSAEWPEQPPTIQKSVELSNRSMQIKVPSVNNSRVTVVPEALAAVTSFLKSPSRVAAAFATIDVGGASTDISYFWYSTGEFDALSEPKAWYYSVRSERVGTNNLIHGLNASVDPGFRGPAHERLSNCSSLEAEIQPEYILKFKDALEQSYRNAFRDAYSLDGNLSSWVNQAQPRVAKWTLLLLGGGCGFRVVKDFLQFTPPSNSNAEEHGEVEMLRPPKELGVLLPVGKYLPLHIADGNDILTQCGHLVTVAHGLAFRSPDIPKYGMHDLVVLPPRQPDPEQPAHGNDG